jgi:uncharacterized integral membrane protein (TIGR00698 family)
MGCDRSGSINKTDRFIPYYALEYRYSSRDNKRTKPSKQCDFAMSTSVSPPTRLAPARFDVSAWTRKNAPGVMLCVAITLAAWGLQLVEQHIFGRAWLEALVLAILLGTAVRSTWTPTRRWLPGINFSAKTLLEVAIVLLGASLSAQTLRAAGVELLIGILVVVPASMAISYGIGRVLGLHHRIALLVACGNSICGNSAIAAVAPVIDAHSDDVAASIAFTAVLGVVVVLVLPMLDSLLHLSNLQFGTLAGLTVYAVPQVLAATVPVSATSAHIGMLVKLIRVLTLGPVILGLSVGPLLRRKSMSESGDEAVGASSPKPAGLAWRKFLPWFIIGFLLLAAVRSADLLPAVTLQPISDTADVLTIVSMAALGLGVDLRTVVKAGARVTLAVVLSIIALTLISLAMIHMLGMS